MHKRTFVYHRHADTCTASLSSDSSGNLVWHHHTGAKTISHDMMVLPIDRPTLILLSRQGTQAVVTCLRGALLDCSDCGISRSEPSARMNAIPVLCDRDILRGICALPSFEGMKLVQHVPPGKLHQVTSNYRRNLIIHSEMRRVIQNLMQADAGTSEVKTPINSREDPSH
jgi:hypothetical protein